MKQEPVEETIIPQEKGEKILKMEHYKIYKLLNNSVVSKLLTKKWIKVNDLSSSLYSVNKDLRFKTSMFRSHLCDYSDAYIVVKAGTSVTGTNVANRRNKKLIFKNKAPFSLCISKINNTFIENVMPMYKLWQYSDVCCMKSGSLWNYYRDEVNIQIILG